MNQRLRNSESHLTMSDDARPRVRRRASCTMRGPSSEILADARFQFDSDAWAALVEEQRLQIARAAGVDPSKVRIYVGH